MGELGKRLELECERVLLNVESRIESFMAIEDGDAPYEMFDGVVSCLVGEIDGKGVEISIRVQPGSADDYWKI